jgi:hypothetical protein
MHWIRHTTLTWVERGVDLVAIQQMLGHVCALMTVAFLLDADCPAVTANPDGSGPQPAIRGNGHGDVVPAGWFGHA